MSKKKGITKPIVIKEFVMTLLASTQVFHKKGEVIFDFCDISGCFCWSKEYFG